MFTLNSNLLRKYSSFTSICFNKNVMSVVITEIYGNKEKIAEHSKNGSLVV